MTRKVIILISVILLAVMAASAKKEKENSRAEIKVSCRYPHKRLKTDAKAFDFEYNMTLLAKSGYSKFFSQITGYHDSLDSTPSGKALFNKMMGEGVKKLSKRATIVLSRRTRAAFMYLRIPTIIKTD